MMARKYDLKAKGPAGRSGIDYAKELNAEQLAAVVAPPGPALVIAGAGSGKTRTLTYRVAYLLDKGVPADNILLLTFTNKAAKEMLQRVEGLVPYETRSLWGGTFHSVGNRLLRKHGDMLGYSRNFSIIDREDQKDLMKTVVAESGIDVKACRFPKAEVLVDIQSSCVNTARALVEVLDDKYPYFSELEDEIASVLEEYRAKKKAANCVDFDDLLVLTLRLFKQEEDVLRNYQRKFQFILVDEYQDVNAVQAELIDLLAADHQSVMVVGDDAQSIYSWRGADFENILEFPDRYTGAKVHRIETNYRSVPEILALANASIRHNKRQFEKELRADRASMGQLPALVPVSDPRTQAEFIAQRLLEMRDEGLDLGDIAVLYRAHYHSMEIQMELTRRGIPFRITSGLRFFEQAHIKDVAAYLRFAVNPADEVSFKRIVRMLQGIGGRTAEKLWNAWVAVCPVGGVVGFSGLLGGMKVPAKVKPAWNQLGKVMDALVPGDGRPSTDQMIGSVIDGIYDEYMRVAFPNYEARREDLEQLRHFSTGFAEVQDFLSQLSLLSGSDVAADGPETQDEECVTLSSVHQAKGLEWRAVFVVWLADGMFPNARAVDPADPSTYEEERRLFYVAMTRAMDALYLVYPLTWPNNRGMESLQRPSLFLGELPVELMELWEVGGTWDRDGWGEEPGDGGGWGEAEDEPF